MREISVLGVSLTDYSLREAMRRIGEFLENGSLNTVCYLNNALLVSAKDDEELRSQIEAMDLLVPGNSDILQAGGINAGSRAREVSGNFFLRELLKRFAKEKRRVFLVASTDAELVSLREKLLQVQGRLTFFGSYVYDLETGQKDALFNEINSVIPDVVMSVIASPYQEQIMSEAKMMVNSRLWVALLPDSVTTPVHKKRLGKFFVDFIDRTIFKRVVNRYGEEK